MFTHGQVVDGTLTVGIDFHLSKSLRQCSHRGKESLFKRQVAVQGWEPVELLFVLASKFFLDSLVGSFSSSKQSLQSWMVQGSYRQMKYNVYNVSWTYLIRYLHHRPHSLGAHHGQHGTIHLQHGILGLLLSPFRTHRLMIGSLHLMICHLLSRRYQTGILLTPIHRIVRGLIHGVLRRPDRQTRCLPISS